MLVLIRQKMYYSSQVSNGANFGGSEKNIISFQQHVFDDPVSCLRVDFSQNLLCQSSGNNSTPLFGSVVDSILSSDEDTFCETYSELACHDVSLYQHFRHEIDDLEGDDSAPVKRVEVECANSTNFASSIVPKSKKRIKWTKDLHELFVAAVNTLGGALKARPKAVLEMMNSKSLTIFQVKSHLQKYRTTMYVQNTCKKGYEERQGRDMVTELQQQICMQIEESRQLQLEIGKGIQEQLEVQRSLQMLVEEQKKKVNIVCSQKQTKQIGVSKSLENDIEIFLQNK
ncbi:hypothetical protein VNO78_21265 [Psophocarpus tetragonolobus]|uniref:Myb-like domain-containing protein n=1 Tax=Psophocarpus tetragonolobus TaxID=3891 RepID=A0AAN9SG91_PSOTE